MDELVKPLPCPFCEKQPHMDCSGPNEYEVECYCQSGIIVCGPSAPSVAEAIKAWNTRPQIESLQDEVKRLRTRMEEGFKVDEEVIDMLTKRAEAAERLNGELREALERLGSMEAFNLSRAIDPKHDAELLARIDFARAALDSKEKG